MKDKELLLRLEKEFRYTHRKTGKQAYATFTFPYDEEIEDMPQGFGYITTFHASAVRMLHLPDEYFCGIRADHFVVEYGYTEEQEFCPEDWRPGEVLGSVLITANHKGTRTMVWFPNKDPAIDEYFDTVGSFTALEKEWPAEMKWHFNWDADYSAWGKYIDCGHKAYPAIWQYLLRSDPAAAIVLTHSLFSVAFARAAAVEVLQPEWGPRGAKGHGFEGDDLKAVNVFESCIMPAIREIQSAKLSKAALQKAEKLASGNQEQLAAYLKSVVESLPAAVRSQAEMIIEGMRLVAELNEKTPPVYADICAAKARRTAEAVLGFVPLTSS